MNRPISRYVVACAESCLTACDFATREEAERALEAIAKVIETRVAHCAAISCSCGRRPGATAALSRIPPASW
jgi:hypothetical protein